MRNIIKIVLLFVALHLLSCSPVGAKDYVIGFYNVENLFDTVDDPHRNDNDFLPDGANKWTPEKYAIKQADNKFLTRQTGRYKGTPFRSFSGGEFINGYSDHYPTYIIIGK